jgi:hypothetical protein
MSHFLLSARAELKHHVSYCANRRVVQRDWIGNKIPNLPSTLPGADDAPLVYAGYVSSDYLNGRVDPHRVGFTDIPTDGATIFPEELSWNDIETAVLVASQSHLRDFTDTVKVEKEKHIRKYVNYHAPQYKYIVKHYPERLDRIPPDLSDEKLDVQLYEMHRDIEVSVRQKADELLSVGLQVEDEGLLEEQWQRFAALYDELNEVGKASLAKYIIHRKLMLAFLDRALSRQTTGGYGPEEAVHRIIFPLRKTSDDIAYDDHNLWILDEKLAYHRYLASDIRLDRMEVLEADSERRPDLIVFFDTPIAIVEGESPYASGIVIFEFKRPLRDDYSPDNNPVDQVLGYVKDIKAGKIRDRGGRPLNVSDSTPFYCYIVCDLTPRMRDRVENSGLTLTPDAQGYFGYNPGRGAYIEVIGFDKLVQDAKKRNRVLFEKLGLPDRV